MAFCWERIRLFRLLFTVLILNTVLVVLVPLPFGIWGGMWNSIGRLLIIAFLSTFQSIQAQGRRRLLKSGPAMGRRKRSPSAEGTRRGEHEKGASPSRKGVSPEKMLGSERL